MELMEAGRKTEVSEFDVATTIKQNIVGFDIPGMISRLY
jgi:hypothetical protein